MFLTPLLLLGFSLLVNLLVFSAIGDKYALDFPNKRKIHNKAKPQIGGLILGSLFLPLCWILNLAPEWYLISALCSIIIGAIDDVRPISWKVKIIIQFLIAIYISTIFWNTFDSINFFQIQFSFSQIELFLIFLVWFIGIYNSVNLLDGLDGLVAGFFLIICLAFSLIGSYPIIKLNVILSILIISFLVFNQRPSKIFMGDAGSYFLGFHIAVLPLLIIKDNAPIKQLDMTPFIIIASYLIADTTRVFITRILSRKNPMTPDTIHLHHLILKQSGSYLSSIGFIYLFTLISVIFAFISIDLQLSTNLMIIFLALVLFFVLVPPIESYIPFITRIIIGPLYKWQGKQLIKSPYSPRTLFITLLFILLIISIFNLEMLNSLTGWQNILGIILLAFTILLLRRDKIIIYISQLSIVVFLTQNYQLIELTTQAKLFSLFLFIIIMVSFIEKRFGSDLRQFSSLDLLIIIFSFFWVCISIIDPNIPVWYGIIIFSIWFSLFILFRRTIFID